MPAKCFPAILCCFLFLATNASSAPKEKEPEPMNCLDCHADLAPEKSVHPAVAMGCPSCHTAIDASDIPHKKTNKVAKGLSADQPDLCYNCHDKGMFTKKSVHPPVAGGMCTSCHSPHSSDQASLLLQPVADLCITCHATLTNRHVLANYGLGDVHPLKGKPDPSKAGQELSCISCHDPHSSSQQKLYRNETGSLCLMCHTKIVVRTEGH